MSEDARAPEPLLKTSEVAQFFRVDRRTVGRWADAGKITAVRTPGGHLRFRESEVRQLLKYNTFDPHAALSPPQKDPNNS